MPISKNESGKRSMWEPLEKLHHFIWMLNFHHNKISEFINITPSRGDIFYKKKHSQCNFFYKKYIRCANFLSNISLVNISFLSVPTYRGNFYVSNLNGSFFQLNASPTTHRGFLYKKNFRNAFFHKKYIRCANFL